MEKLRENIKEWVQYYIGPDFIFREHQEETIYSICYNILNKDKSTQIIEAPTGSGKSLLLIISAGVLWNKYGIKSYILCSDLFLWKQYDDFIYQHPFILQQFGSIKGQTGNYICTENNEDIRNSKCRIANISWGELCKGNVNGFGCASTCRYVQARYKAIKSGVTLMTYQLYINVVTKLEDTDKVSSFEERPVIFCDECHNIPNIVSNRLSPGLYESSLEHFKAIYDYNCKLHTGLFADDTGCDNLQEVWQHPRLMEIAFKNHFKKLTYKSDIFNEEMGRLETDSLNEFIDNFLNKFKSTCYVLQANMKSRMKSSSMKLNKNEMEVYKHSTWFEMFDKQINEFSSVIKKTGHQYLVKYVNDISRTLKDGTQIEDRQVVYKCAKEDYICNKCIFEPSGHQVLVSATIGDKESYTDNLGISQKENKYVNIPTTFEFDKSPIFVYSGVKMSQYTKEQNLPKISNVVYGICKQFNKFRGIIQTGSFENAEYVYKNAPSDIKPRLLLYKDNADKANMVEWHKVSENTVLIGPTLNEGVDLPGDYCRFIIMMKVPYPNLGDPLVQAKNVLFPRWYNSETSNSIIQGIGRGNRFSSDWCITYMLDGCFQKLYGETKNQYPDFIRNRIRFM